MDKWPYSEARIADHLGMPRKDLVKVRGANLRKNRDWTLRDGEVALCLRGVSKLLKALQVAAGLVDISVCCFDDGQEKKGPVLLLCDRGQIPSPIKLKVRRLFPNPHLLEAVEVERPMQLCQVLLKSTENLTIGMIFDAIPDVGHPGYWKLAGPLPRWRGRW